MRANFTCKADVEATMKLKFEESMGEVVAYPTVYFKQDETELAKRFGKELADAVFAALAENPQRNLPTEELEHDVSWLLKKFQPDLVFENHNLKLGGLAFTVQPQFKAITPIKGEPEVMVRLTLPIIVKEKTAGKVVRMAGQIVEVDLSTQQELIEATPPTVLHKAGKHGNPQAVTH